MARRRGRKRGRFSSRQGCTNGECSTSVESSSQASQDMQFRVPSAVGTTTRRKGKNQIPNQYGSDDFSTDSDCDRRKAGESSCTVDYAAVEVDTAAEMDIAALKPDLEAYCRGSWWDVEILEKSQDKYLVHYLKFSDQENEWLPLAHLRMRCRTSNLLDCCKIYPGIDVCVMTRHPHSEEKSAAWFDAKVIDIDRRPHTPKSCKCSFKIALYIIPTALPRDCRERNLLPISLNAVDWKKLSIMREARSMSFEEIIAASLPDVINTPNIWAKDGARWHSSFDYGGASWDRSPSFESRVAGGGIGPSLSRGYHEEHAPIFVPELKPFGSFLEEEGYIIENTPTLSCDGSDEDVVIVSSIPGSKAQPIDLDMDDVAICENDDMDYDFKCLDRYSSDDEFDDRAASPEMPEDHDEFDERAASPERPEDLLESPNPSPERPEDLFETLNPTTSLGSLGNLQEDLDEVVLSDFRPLEPTDQIPFKPETIPSVETIPLVSVPIPPADPATSFEDSDGDDIFAELLEQSIADPETATMESARSSEDSDEEGFADYLVRNIPRNCVAKRSSIEDQGVNHGIKRRRINSQRIGIPTFKPPCLPRPRDKEMSIPKFSFWKRPDQKQNKTVKEQARVYENQSVTASAPVNLDRSECFGTVEKWKEMIDPESPPVADILARSRDASKTGLPTQPFSHKEKRPKKVGNAAVPKKVGNAVFPKKVVVEITYAELFKSVEPAQCIVPSEKDRAEESGLLPSWNPFMESVGPEPLQDDPLAEFWEDMRFAQKSGNKGNDELEKIVEESTNSDDECENLGGYECVEHTLEFDQEIGEVCGVCGLVVMEIGNIWARDNAKRTAILKESDVANDEDSCGSDYGLAVWDSYDDKIQRHNSIEGGSNIELIPDLAKKMQRHQKQGFHFLWRNLAGQDANGNPCFPQIEPGGCVLSHAPGTGKTFLIISFLKSYMTKYPKCRPIIVAPKIMLQPWEKEFRKWNVDIPVYNFNQAGEQGKKIFQNHQESGVVQYVRSKKNMLVNREAMLWEWLKTPSVLVISYQMFNRLTLPSVTGDAAKRIKRILLNYPSIAVLDEGHFARNNLSQVQRQLMAIKTPLRVLLSGTLFQNNFEELYTCLNLARSGFVSTFAKIAGLKVNMQQETEPHSDVENERSRAEWKETTARAADAQAKKLFIEEIGNKIDKGQLSKFSPEYAQGLERLHRLTTPFVHHYTGGILRDLPPLRDFTIVLQPAALQEKMIKLLSEKMQVKTMLEREGLLSLVCIHPSLLSRHNVGKTFTDLLSPEEMAQAATDDPAVGVKTRFVMNLLEKLRQKDKQEEEKMLIFCLNLFPLTLLENMLKKKFGWVREQEILHIDGKVTADERQSIIERFNDPKGKIRVLLLSTKACGEGITLTGASRVIFMDVLWNPAVIRQAIHRAFRLGQTKVVHVYRLVVTGSFEEDKYKTMVLKDWKSQTIFNASDDNHEKVKKSDGEVCGPPQHDFWEVEKFSSKDLVLNELERQDAALDQPAFKHVFRHGGLFDDEYKDDPEGKGADATDWLRNIKVDIPDSYEDVIPDSYSMDGEIGGESPESFDIDTDIEDSSGDGYIDDFETLKEDVLLAPALEEKAGRDSDTTPAL